MRCALQAPAHQIVARTVRWSRQDPQFERLCFPAITPIEVEVEVTPHQSSEPSRIANDPQAALLLRIAVICNDAHLDTCRTAVAAILWRSCFCAPDCTRPQTGGAAARTSVARKDAEGDTKAA